MICEFDVYCDCYWFVEMVVVELYVVEYGLWVDFVVGVLVCDVVVEVGDYVVDLVDGVEGGVVYVVFVVDVLVCVV